jgi:hypothetical protein
MGNDPICKFFLDQRNFILKEGPIQGTPWYRRRLSIIWEDVRGWILQHFHKWKQVRQIARRHARQQQESGTQSNKGSARYYFDNPEWESRPALDLINEYLNKLEAVVIDAEAQFAGKLAPKNLR